jgi:hypothetical protein
VGHQNVVRVAVSPWLLGLGCFYVCVESLRARGEREVSEKMKRAILWWLLMILSSMAIGGMYATLIDMVRQREAAEQISKEKTDE